VVALAVAVYVTKVPIPFVNKAQSRPAESQAESQKNKDWNPNAGLPGRLPPQPEVDPAAEPAPAAPVPAAPAGPAQPGGAPAPVPPGPAARAGDPLGDLAKSRSEASGRPAGSDAPAAPSAPAAPPAAADPFQYFVQAGAFRQADEAEQQRARLLLMGLQARVSEREQAGRMVYRVRLGPFERRDEADKTLERLEGAGVSAVVVRVQR
jgi:cell division protein FtsN